VHGSGARAIWSAPRRSRDSRVGQLESVTWLSFISRRVLSKVLFQSQIQDLNSRQHVSKDHDSLISTCLIDIWVFASIDRPDLVLTSSQVTSRVTARPARAVRGWRAAC
jgi:hypothetical protein